MATYWRMPQLAIPFLPVGFATGWLTAGILQNPLFRITLLGSPWISAIVAALAAAAVGAWLTRRCAPSVEWASEAPSLANGATYVRLAVGVLAGGAVSGGVVGALSAFPSQTAYGVGTGLVSGLLAGVGAYPVCALVVFAARRSARARRGSLVASADRRAIGSTLATALAAMSAVAALDWPASHAGTLPSPLLAVGVAVASGVVLLLVLAADLLTLQRTRHAFASAGTMERLREGGHGARTVASIDLGVGAEVWARLARGTAYRSVERPVAFVLGHPEEALRAVRRAIVQSVVGLATVVAVLVLHLVAAGMRADAIYSEHRCAQGFAADCLRGASMLAEGAASEEDARRALELYERACAFGVAGSCRAGAAFAEATQLRSTLSLSWKDCDAGSVNTCVRRARHLMEENTIAGLVEAKRHLVKACELGHAESCDDLPLLHSLTTFTASGPPSRAVFECVRGSLSACLEAVAPQRVVATRVALLLHAQACRLGSASSCYFAGYGFAYQVRETWSFDGVVFHDTDEHVAAGLLERSCRKGFTAGCYEAAHLLRWREAIANSALADELLAIVERKGTSKP